MFTSAISPSVRLTPRGGPQPFAHPAEEELARILSYYGVNWVYEPTSFVLRHQEDGSPAESLTPDFFLPDYGLYLELTTMRQSLVTRKNRKLRRLRETHPQVDVKLLYRRDFQRLIATHGGFGRDGRVETATPRMVLSKAEIEARIALLAGEIAGTWRDRQPEQPPLLLTVSSASTSFSEQLAIGLAASGTAFEQDRLHVDQYHVERERPTASILGGPRSPLSGRHVMIVTDIVSTGLSSRWLAAWCRKQGAAEVEITTLLDRKESRWLPTPVSYSAFAAPGDLLVGYGLSIDDRYATLPDIHSLE